MSLNETIPGSNRSQAVVVQVLSFSAHVASTNASILRELHRVYPTFPPPSSAPLATTTQIAITERRGLDGPPIYRIYQAGRPAGAVRSRIGLLGSLENLIDTSAIAHIGSDHLLVHAGAVVGGAGGIVIPGEPGAGKSTLVAALCLSGFGYLSDELAIIDDTGLTLAPFSKAICLKSGGWRVLSACYELPCEPPIARRINGSRVRFLPLPPASGSNPPARIRYVLIPRRRPGDVTTLTPLSRRQALAELLQHSLNLPRHSPQGLEALARVAEEAACYSLTYHSLPDAVAAVSALTGAKLEPEPRIGLIAD